MNESSGRYYVKNTEGGSFVDMTTMFDGVAILKMDGFNEKGKPVNIYTAQWINDQTEDFLITTTDGNNNPVVIRENTDIEITFIVMQRYASGSIDVLTQHDALISYLTGSDVWLKSSYMGNKSVHCVCLKEYKPTLQKLDRGAASYMTGTITLHTLGAPT